MRDKVKLPGTDLSISVTNKNSGFIPEVNETKEDPQEIQEEFISVETQLSRELSAEDRSPCNWTVVVNSSSIVEAYSVSGNKFYGNKPEFSKIFLTS